jgi:hypothetical protein
MHYEDSRAEQYRMRYRSFPILQVEGNVEVPHIRLQGPRLYTKSIVSHTQCTSTSAQARQQPCAQNLQIPLRLGRYGKINVGEIEILSNQILFVTCTEYNISPLP